MVARRRLVQLPHPEGGVRQEAGPEAAGAGDEKTGGLVIFAWSGDLDRVWPTLILANTAAALGRPVTIFFTFWGLRVLQRNDKRFTGQNWMQTKTKNWLILSSAIFPRKTEHECKGCKTIRKRFS